MPLLDHLNDFRNSVSDAEALIVSAHLSDNTGNPLWRTGEVQTITQAAFVKFFIAWESFLERTLADYMRGEPSAAGSVLTRFASPTDHAHALKILIGTQKYVDYSNPEIVRKLAGLYLDNGGPFETVLSAVNIQLFDLKTIRNAAAHLSSTTTKQLDSLASRKLGPPRSGVTVYDLITSVDPSSSTGDTILRTYISELDAAAYAIVHA